MLPATLSHISLKMSVKSMVFDANCNSTYKIKERKQKIKKKNKKHENSSYKFELFSDIPEIIEKDQVSRLCKKKNKKSQQVCIFARGQLFLKSTFAMRNKSFVSQVSMSRVILLSSNFSFI